MARTTTDKLHNNVQMWLPKLMCFQFSSWCTHTCTCSALLMWSRAKNITSQGVNPPGVYGNVLARWSCMLPSIARSIVIVLMQWCTHNRCIIIPCRHLCRRSCNNSPDTFIVEPRVGPGHPSSPLSIYFLIFSPFYFLLSFIGFTYFLLLSIPSLSIRIVPLHFQAGGRRRRSNLGLVCFFNVICIP